MTREEALAGHRKLWNEIADMIERGVKRDHANYYKEKALEHLGEERSIAGNCYLCEYADNHEEKISVWSCKFDCPVEWYGGSCMFRKSEYKLFERAIEAQNYTIAAILARKIANLPERVVE